MNTDDSRLADIRRAMRICTRAVICSYIVLLAFASAPVASQSTQHLPPAPPAPARVAVRPAIVNVPSCGPTGNEYPAAARRSMAVGETMIRFAVDERGVLISAEITRPSGSTPEHKLLDQLALRRLSGCTFRPGRDSSGQPTGGAFDLAYKWWIDGAPTRTSHPFFNDLQSCIVGIPEVVDTGPLRRFFGTTVLLFQLDGAGRVLSGRIEQPSSPHPEHSDFDASALKGLADCQFSRLLAGTEVRVEYEWIFGRNRHGVALYTEQQELLVRLARKSGVRVEPITVTTGEERPVPPVPLNSPLPQK